VSRVRRLAAGLALAAVRRRARAPLRPGERERIVPAGPPEPRGELVVVALLGLGSVCAIAFVSVYAFDRIPGQTQYLGLSLGLALLSFAAALIVLAKRLIVTEEIEEDYPALDHPEEQELIVQTLAESGSRFSRRGLLKLGAGAAGASLGVALLAPLASLGPIIDMKPFYTTPWRRGRRLVDENARPYRASDIEAESFYTAFPKGADFESYGAPVLLVRLKPSELHLPPALADYPAEGIVAYSKICTHAGCAISLYRAPLFQPDEPKPAFVCPCHYSTFDPATGGTVTFGPAGRKLPMLPLMVDGRGYLQAAGNFDGPVGPSWWGVRLWKPKSGT
jgi:ubiquinol-cytochrome c reductase iron-sulfur subunit